jgi:hypothetical protein
MDLTQITMPWRGNDSFAPTGLVRFALSPTACAVGCILAPLRGFCSGLLTRTHLTSQTTALTNMRKDHAIFDATYSDMRSPHP